jgi:hypothetical protein
MWLYNFGSDLVSFRSPSSFHLLVLEKYITAKVHWHLLARRSSLSTLHDLVLEPPVWTGLCEMDSRPKKGYKIASQKKYNFNRLKTDIRNVSFVTVLTASRIICRRPV